MPDITGMSLDQARTKLKDMGLILGKVTTASDDSKEDGVILMQSPPANSKVNKGTTIDVTVNKIQAKTVTVPRVVGMTLKDAKDALASMGLSVGQISGSGDDTAVITSQSPSPGSKVDDGSIGC